MSDGDLKEIIYAHLRNMQGCTLKEHNGIVVVTMPHGDVWDFTVPMKRNKESPRTFWEGVEGRSKEKIDE